MEPRVFYKLLDMLKVDIQLQDTNYRKCIKPVTRLSLTLRYLCHGMYIYIYYYVIPIKMLL